MGVLKVKVGGTWTEVPGVGGGGGGAPGIVAYRQTSAQQSITAVAFADVTTLTATFTAIAGRTYRTTAVVAYIKTTAVGTVSVVLANAADGVLNGTAAPSGPNAYGFVVVDYVESNISGTQTRKVRLHPGTDGVAVQGAPGGGYYSTLVIEDITAAAAVGAPTTSLWTPVTFQNSWANLGAPYQLCQYRMVGDVVQVRGTMAGGTIGVAPAFTLPVGYRPPAILHLPTYSNAAFGGITLLDIGEVRPVTGSNAWFGVNFQFSVTP